MAKGKVKRGSIWDRCVEELQKRETSFRMVQRGKTAVIQIRQYQDGDLIREFSSQGYRWRNTEGLTTSKEEKEIESCYKLCLQADEEGSWVAAGGVLAVVRRSRIGQPLLRGSYRI